MDEDANVMDELFFRINLLEEENKNLHKKISEADKLLEEKHTKELLKGIDEKELLGDLLLEDVLKENEDLKVCEGEKMEIDDKKEEKQPDSCPMLEEIQIIYTPYEDINRIYIKGSFTKWEKKEMRKQDGVFFYSTIVVKGFRYFYSFLGQDQLLVDFEQEYSENIKTGQINNFITLYKPDSVDIVDFDSDLHWNILEENIGKNIKCLMGSDDENVILLEAAKTAITAKNVIDVLVKKREEKCAEIAFDIDTKTQKLKKNLEGRFKDVKDMFQNRIIYKNGVYFVIVSVEPKECGIRCLRLYDKHGIKMDLPFQKKHAYFERLYFDENFFNNLKILNEEESKKVMDEYDKSDRILKIYYQLLGENQTSSEFGAQQSLEFNNQISNVSNKEKEILPYKVFPEDIELHNYNLQIANDTITMITHKESNMKVIFEAILINEQKKKKFLGLVSTSLIKVYSALYNQNIVNVLHIHMDDTNESITVDSFFLDKDEDEGAYKNFSTDLKGKKLDYKFLFKNYRLQKIYYSMSAEFIDEPNFEEIRICMGKIVKIQKSTKYDNYYGKIKNIPVGMLARRKNDQTNVEAENKLKLEKFQSTEFIPEGTCTERALDLQGIQGYIDLELICNNKGELLSHVIHVSVPVCNLKILSQSEELNVEKLLVQSSKLKSNHALEELNEILKRYELYESKYLGGSSEDNLKLLTLESAKEIIHYLDQDLNEKALKKLLEKDEYDEKLDRIIKIKENLAPKLTLHMRMLMFSAKK